MSESSTWELYRDNLMRHLTLLTWQTEKTAMARLGGRGYGSLTMSFSQPLSLLHRQPQRLTDLARHLGISKQLCRQNLRPIEAAGYIAQAVDPTDRRARQVRLTLRGEALVRDARAELAAIESEYGVYIGAEALGQFSEALYRVAETLPIRGVALLAPVENLPGTAAGLIGAVTRELQQQLMRKLLDRGHARLQLSFAQVLTCIDPQGTTVSAIAAQNGISSPAVSRIARQLERLEYIQRHDGDDGRSRKMMFTPRGMELIGDSVAAMQELERGLAAVLAPSQWLALTSQARALYQHLGGAMGQQRWAAAHTADSANEQRAGRPPDPEKRAETDAGRAEGVLRLLHQLLPAVLQADVHGRLQLSPRILEELMEARLEPECTLHDTQPKEREQHHGEPDLHSDNAKATTAPPSSEPR